MSFVGTDTFPYVSRETWCTRGWLLVRKVRRYALVTDHDRRVAMLLLKDKRHPRSAKELALELEAIAHGFTDVQAACEADPTA